MKNIVKCEKGQGSDTEIIKADMNNIYHNQFDDRTVKFK